MVLNLSIGLLLPSMCIFTLLFVVVSECADFLGGFECCVGACFDDSASLNWGTARMAVDL